MSPTGAGLDEEARAILRENTRGRYTVPSPALYPFQWNWDSAFTALGWAEFDLDRAWVEIESLLEGQWPSGMIPHIVFWSDDDRYFPGPDVWRTPVSAAGVRTSGISQPPVLATVVRRLAETEIGGGARAASHLDAIDRWHRWWHRARDPEGLGVIAATHPWESGRDNSTDWERALGAVDASAIAAYERRDLATVDASMRPLASDYDRYVALVEFGASVGWDDASVAACSPFLVADPGITAILLRAERDLAAMLVADGRDASDVRARIERMEQGFERLWNPEADAYCALDLRRGERAGVATSVSFLAPYAGVTAHLDELIDELEKWAAGCRFLLPSIDARHPLFESERYWRGPVWLVISGLVATGLAEHGHGELADQIRTSGRELIRRSGFSEYFHPLTGDGLGGSRFSWTAAMWLTWLRDR